MLLLLAILVHFSYLVDCNSNVEERLVNTLLDPSNYNPQVRPVANYTDILTVKHGLALSQLVKLDEKSGIISTSALIKLQWNDVYLKWKPTDYDDITELNIDIALIWSPQIVVFNNADDSLGTSAIPRAIVRYDGSVKAVIPRILQSTCTIKVKDFPFDRQLCEIRFGSFQYELAKMDLQPISTEIQMSHFQTHGEWLVTKTKNIRTIVCHAFSESKKFVQISYKIILDRRPLYYIANFILPCVLISAITILLFLIPPQTGEQMAVGVTILLSLSVFFILLESKLPETSDSVPLIGKYYAATIVQVSMAVLGICLVLRYQHHDPTEVPNWMKKYILGTLAKYLRITTSQNPRRSMTRVGVFTTLSNESTEASREHRMEELAKKYLHMWTEKAKKKRVQREREMDGEGRSRVKSRSNTTLTPDTMMTDLSDEEYNNGIEEYFKQSTQEDAHNEEEQNANIINESDTPNKLEENNNNSIQITPRDNKESFPKAHVEFRGTELRNRRHDTNSADRKAKREMMKIKKLFEDREEKCIEVMAASIQEENDADDLVTEWQMVGKVVNYFMMWCFIFAATFTFLGAFGPFLFISKSNASDPVGF